MRLSPRHAAVAVFIAAGSASAMAFGHMASFPSFVIVAPGYLVQAWLFERNWALGGAGYAATMIGVSTLFWTVVIVICIRSGTSLVHRLRRRRDGAV